MYYAKIIRPKDDTSVTMYVVAKRRRAWSDRVKGISQTCVV